MGHNDWTRIIIRAENAILKLKELNLVWGKIHEYGNFDKELPASDYMNKNIRSGRSMYIHLAGRSNSPSGTEGSFEIFDGDVKIGKFQWECPYKGDNSIKWNYAAMDGDNYAEENYKVSTLWHNKTGGALENVTVICTKIA